MAKKKVRPCWQQQGLGGRSAAKADLLFEKMFELLKGDSELVKREGGHDSITDAVLSECVFRISHLPHRTKEFQEKYLKENA